MRESNFKIQFVNYFKKNLRKGYTIDSLKWALINQGYSRVIVDSALEEAQKQMALEAPEFKEKPVIKYEVLDQNDRPVKIRKSWWKRIFGL